MREGEPVTLLARAPEFPWPVVIVLAALAAMCLLDRLPARSFYSRRAFEPPVRTYADQAARLAELEATQAPTEPLRGELYRRGPELGQPASRELEPW
jgi:hypothetical protein